MRRSRLARARTPARLFVLLVCLTAVAGGTTANSAAVVRSPASVACGPATAIDRTAPLGRAIPVGAFLWLGVYPYKAGYPTKVVVMAKQRLRLPLVLRGMSCANGRALRFWYHRNQLPFPDRPATEAELGSTGSLRATFGPWPARAFTGGYFLFSTQGDWKILAYQSGHAVASIVISPHA
jgi:hypothetical protein